MFAAILLCAFAVIVLNAGILPISHPGEEM